MTNKEAIKYLIQQRRNDIQADIERLSELRSNYNCFVESEEPYYRTLSNAIQALRDKCDRVGTVRNGQIRL